MTFQPPLSPPMRAILDLTMHQWIEEQNGNMAAAAMYDLLARAVSVPWGMRVADRNSDVSFGLTGRLDTDIQVVREILEADMRHRLGLPPTKEAAS